MMKWPLQSKGHHVSEPQNK